MAELPFMDVSYLIQIPGVLTYMITIQEQATFGATAQTTVQSLFTNYLHMQLSFINVN